MDIETETKITEYYLGSKEQRLVVTVKHDSDYEYGYLVSLGCAEATLSSDDLRKLVKVFNKSLSMRKAAAK